jgi:hypothetical protein
MSILGDNSLSIVGGGAAAVLALLAIVHCFWAVGGRTGMVAAVPSGDRGPLFKPGRIATLFVAAALMGLAGLFALSAGMFGRADWAQRWPAAALAVTALVFLARAVGEFNYVGLFKRRRPGSFARLDTLVYSPLCLALAVVAGLLAWRSVG